ncbi:MAG: NACHT domain-containing protein [Rhodoglobus sp.]
MDYAIQNLGHREFEHLTQSLAMAELGNGLRIFGSGPDGGREATFNGEVAFPKGDGPLWNGRGVVQAKFCEHSASVSENFDWLKRQVQREFSKWATKKSQRKKMPKYFLLATNVRLSANEDSGGADRALQLLEDSAKRVGIKSVALWHYDTIARMLDQQLGIRTTYAGFLTIGDVVEGLKEFVSPSAAALGPRLRIHAASEMVAKQWVRLGDAGYDGNQKLQLGDAAIDLPALTRAGDADEREVQVLRHLIERADPSLRPTERGSAPFGVVLVGGPGQGKSTIAQFTCQMYRSALVDLDAASLGPEADETLRSFRKNLERLGLPAPKNRRWPAYVELSKFGDFVGEDKEASLLAFIASQTKVNGRAASVEDLELWLKTWPWLVVLDGLDEVPSAEARENVTAALSRFVVATSAWNCDVLFVATTRPQGYHGEFGPIDPEQLDLRSLTPSESRNYGHRLIELRHAGDPEMVEEIGSRFDLAVDDPTTSRLTATPLQSTIMTYLLEKRKRAPQTRHALFAVYYDTIYDRETNKPGYLGELLDKYREEVDFIHEQAALVLQIRGERESESEPTLRLAALERMVVDKLTIAGHSEEAVATLSRELMRAATDRLVLLVAVRGGQVGFEIRSLQEFMAAKALCAGDPNLVLDRLRTIGPSAQWRNVWGLAAGRVFSTNPHVRDGLLGVLRHLDLEPSPSAFLVGYGERLALDMLEDDIAASHPSVQRALLSHALGILSRWPGPDVLRLGSVVAQLGLEVDNDSYEIVSAALRSGARSTSGKGRLSVFVLLTHWKIHSGVWGGLANSLLELEYAKRSISQGFPPYPASARPANIGVILRDRIDLRALSANSAHAIERVAELLGAVKYRWIIKLADNNDLLSGTSVPIQIAIGFDSHLREIGVEQAIVSAVESLTEEEAQVAVWMRQLMITIHERDPVGSHESVAAALSGSLKEKANEERNSASAEMAD